MNKFYKIITDKNHNVENQYFDSYKKAIKYLIGNLKSFKGMKCIIIDIHNKEDCMVVYDYNKLQETKIRLGIA